MHGDAKLVGGPIDQPANVRSRTEPQLTTEGQAGSQRLRYQQPGAAVACRDGRCFVEEGTRIEDLKDLGMGMTDNISIRLG